MIEMKGGPGRSRTADTRFRKTLAALFCREAARGQRGLDVNEKPPGDSTIHQHRHQFGHRALLLLCLLFLWPSMGGAHCYMSWPQDRAYLDVTAVSLESASLECVTIVGKIRGTNAIMDYVVPGSLVHPLWKRRAFWVSPETVVWDCTSEYCVQTRRPWSVVTVGRRIIVDYEKWRIGDETMTTIRMVKYIYLMPHP